MSGDPHDWCVLWRHQSMQIMVSRIEEALDYNAGQLIDKLPGAAIVRMNLTRDQAEKHAMAMRQILDRSEVPA